MTDPATPGTTPAPGPSLEWWNAQLPPKRRAVHAIGHALGMVRDLPLFGHLDADEAPVVRVACLEAFLVNVRLVADFLVVIPGKIDQGHVKAENADTNARTYLPDWTPPSETSETMWRYWRDASSLVVHLGAARFPCALPIDQDDYTDTTLDRLQAVADDCLDLWRTFVDAATQADVEFAQDLANAVWHQRRRP